MKVLLLVSGFPSQASRERGIFNLRSARRLASVADITVVHLRSWLPGRPLIETEQDGALSICRLSVPQIHFGPFCYRWTLKWNLRSLCEFGWRQVRDLVPRHDVIHSVGTTEAGVVGGDWSRRSNVAHVVQAIGSDVNSLQDELLQAGWTDWDRYVDGVACNSDALMQRLCSRYPSLKNVHKVKNGVDPQEFSPAVSGSGESNDSVGTRFLFVGGFPWDRNFRGNLKGGKLLLNAWKLAEQNGIGTLASLVIGGPGSDGSEIRSWRAGLKCPNSVHIAGRMPPEEMPNTLRRCDAVLVPSMEEGLPNIAMEAAASGKAVIARLTGGLPEIVQHGQTGLLFESKQPEDWAEILLNIARDPEKLRTMGRQARTYAEENLSSEHYAIAMQQIYEQAIIRRKGRAVNAT